MRRILFRSIAVLAGIAVGCAAGGYLTFRRYARDYAMVRAFAWSGISAAVSEGQYDRNASDAKQLLLNTLNYFEQGVTSSKIDPIMRNALRMKCGLIEARLSVLENEGGNAQGAKSYMSHEDLKAVGWLDLSETTILQVVKRQQVSPCGVGSQSVAKTIASTNQKPCG